MSLNYPPGTEYKSLLLHENEEDDPHLAAWSSRHAERRGTQLSSGVAQMLQLWPALLGNVLTTFVLVLVACFVFILAILTLVFTTNFSLISPSYPLPSLHLQTRSLHTLPPAATQTRNHTEIVHRYIIMGSEETVNLFYVIAQDATLSGFEKKLLRFYLRAGYKVFLVRVCRTRFVDGEEIERGMYREGTLDDLKSQGSVKSVQIVGNQKENELDSSFMGKRSAEPASGDVKLTADGFVKESPSTADIATYDANLRKEMAADFGQSREFFNRMRKILNKNATFEEDEKDVELNKMIDKLPMLSAEINVTQTNDELSKVQVCTCPACGHVKSKGQAIFGADAKDKVLAAVELLNINYREFLRGSIFEKHLVELDQSEYVRDQSVNEVGASHFNAGIGNVEKEPSLDGGLVKNIVNSDKGGALRIDDGDNKMYDLNLVKLLLLWKFGNSLVLLDDKAILHSKLIDRGRVNLGFHLIYTPYECASVIFNLMREYDKERNMGKSISNVYKAFCKKAPRGFCNAIRYVSVKKRH